MNRTLSLARWFFGAILLVAACAPATPAPSGGGVAPREPEALPQSEQRIVIAMGSIFINLDSHFSIGRAATRYGLFETLVGQKADGSVMPVLATSWKLVNDTTWQFTLAQGRVWHDGTPVTAQDMKFTFDRALNKDLKLGVTNRITTLKELTIVDPQTVQISTLEPDPILLKRVATVSIFPKAYFERIGEKDFAVKPVGSGPFKFKEFIPNDRVVLTGWSEHPSRPKLNELVFRQIPEASAREAGLRTGELQIIEAVSTDKAKGLEGDGFPLIVNNIGRSFAVMLNPFVPGPMADKRVRQAMNYAIDKDSIVKNIFAGLTIPEQGQIIQKETFGFNPNLKPYPYDPAKAKQLLAAAGYPTGFKTKFDFFTQLPQWTPTALFVQQQLKDIGVEAELGQSADSAWTLDRFYGRVPRPELFTSSTSNSPAMDASFALDWYRSNQPEGTRRYNNPEFDRYYEPSLTEMNEAKRLELLQKALEVFHEDPPYLFLVQSISVNVVAKHVRGATPRSDEDYDFAQLYLVR